MAPASGNDLTEDGFRPLIRAALGGRREPSVPVCGLTMTTLEWRIERRALREHLVRLLLDGAVAGEAGGEAVELRPLSLLWLPAGVEHAFATAAKARPPTLYHFRVAVAARAEFPRRALIAHGAAQLRAPCAGFFAACTRPHALRGERVRAQLAALLAEIADALAPMPSGRRGLDAAQRARVHAAVDAARGGIVAPAGLARAVGLAPRYFTHRFTAAFGSAPRTWLARERLRRATQALAEGLAPIAAVAERFGFADPFRFSRAFKRLYGVSPRAWRATPPERRPR